MHTERVNSDRDGAAMQYDLLILGDTPDALAAAEEAALLGRRIAILRPDVDGRGTSSGIGAVLGTFGDGPTDEALPANDDPRSLWNEAVRQQERRIAQLGREFGVRHWRGPVRLNSPNAAEVFVDGVGVTIEADLILIATGTIDRRPRGLSIDGQTVLVPEQVRGLDA